MPQSARGRGRRLAAVPDHWRSSSPAAARRKSGRTPSPAKDSRLKLNTARLLWIIISATVRPMVVAAAASTASSARARWDESFTHLTINGRIAKAAVTTTHPDWWAENAIAARAPATTNSPALR